MKKIIMVLAIGQILLLAKDREWRDGRLLEMTNDITKSQRLYTSGQTYGDGSYNASSRVIEREHSRWRVAVDTVDHFYVASGKDGCKSMENAPIKFAVDGKSLILLSRSGKECKYKLDFAKPVLQPR